MALAETWLSFACYKKKEKLPRTASNPQACHDETKPRHSPDDWIIASRINPCLSEGRFEISTLRGIKAFLHSFCFIDNR
jgi:hypothetical protein